MRSLFGTDGLRGVAGQYPLDERTIYAIGVALGEKVKARFSQREILIGGDTRESTDMIAQRLAAGIANAGARARFAGVITTPAVAYLTRSREFAAGVAISASHNPYQDNGIKIFASSGFKMPDDEEESLERAVFVQLAEAHGQTGTVEPTIDRALHDLYLDYLSSTIATPLDGLHIVLDCANGAASELAPAMFRRLHATVSTINSTPDGRNINLNCGTLHMESLRTAVREAGAHCGVAFDGDADRALFIAASGALVDGDGVLLALSRALHRAGRLPGAICVGTVMANLGLERSLAADGIVLVRTPVGDKYVLEEMIRRGAALGGEQSGHIILRDFATTGDGILTALQFLKIARDAHTGLDNLVSDLEVYPQVLINVRVKGRKPLSELHSVTREIQTFESECGGAGRVLVRFSGTEPLARVMVEGPSLERVQSAAKRIADAIRNELGQPV